MRTMVACVRELKPMVAKTVIPVETRSRPEWRKDRRLARDGYQDLEYLPRDRSGWNATLAAFAYSMRRRIAGRADLDLWAAMHGCRPSARYEQLGEDGLVLWHGTSAPQAEKIREVGLFRKRGVWAATMWLPR